MSLKEKAVELRSQTEKYNVNRGYVLDRHLDNEGVVSLDEGYVPATDNDGLWTGLYTAALCFEYACTKDPEVRAMAKRSLLAMIRLTRITGIEGFTARAIRYPDSRDLVKTGVVGVQDHLLGHKIHSGVVHAVDLLHGFFKTFCVLQKCVFSAHFKLLLTTLGLII